jgi:hypothetical protein
MRSHVERKAMLVFSLVEGNPSFAVQSYEDMFRSRLDKELHGVLGHEAIQRLLFPNTTCQRIEFSVVMLPLPVTTTILDDDCW